MARVEPALGLTGRSELGPVILAVVLVAKKQRGHQSFSGMHFDIIILKKKKPIIYLMIFLKKKLHSWFCKAVHGPGRLAELVLKNL